MISNLIYVLSLVGDAMLQVELPFADEEPHVMFAEDLESLTTDTEPVCPLAVNKLVRLLIYKSIGESL